MVKYVKGFLPHLFLDTIHLPEIICNLFDARWSSLVARRAHNPKVAGSNPALATNFCKSD